MSGLCFWQRNPVTGGTADNRAFSHSPLVQLTDNSTCPRTGKTPSGLDCLVQLHIKWSKMTRFKKRSHEVVRTLHKTGSTPKGPGCVTIVNSVPLSSITAHSFASGTDMAYSQCMHSSLQSRNKSGGGHGVVEAVNKMTIATKSAKCFTVSSRNFKHVAAVKYLQWQKKKKNQWKIRHQGKTKSFGTSSTRGNKGLSDNLSNDARPSTVFIIYQLKEKMNDENSLV